MSQQQPDTTNDKQNLTPELITTPSAPPSSTTDTRMCKIAPSPGMPAFAYETPEEYKIRMRQWHNRIGRKYRSKLSDKFEGLQAILVQTAFLNLEPAATSRNTSLVLDEDGDTVLSPALSPGELLELIRRRQEEEEQDGEDEGEDEMEEDGGVEEGFADGSGRDKMSSNGSSSSAAQRPRMRQSKTINKAGILAIARRTIVKFRAEVETLERELEKSDTDEE